MLFRQLSAQCGCHPTPRITNYRAQKIQQLGQVCANHSFRSSRSRRWHPECKKEIWQGLGYGLWKGRRSAKMGESTSQRAHWCRCVWHTLQLKVSHHSYLLDIAAVSVEQARSRWECLRAPRFEATFAALDCYSEPLSKAFSPEKLEQPFDVVSMQFCMHYAFETSQKARCMLKNVTQWLRPGGTFIGTIPNAEQLLSVCHICILSLYELISSLENVWMGFLQINRI